MVLHEVPMTRAFWIAAPGCAELRSEPLAAPGPGQAGVRTLYSGVSRGTETLVFQGRVPASEAQRMRAPFQAGEFPGPVKYGYASVGEVTAGPAELIGQCVFCLYPHQERYVVPCEALRALPVGVPAQRAILAANLETALNGVWDAGIAPGDRVSVIGAGSVGCLAAWLTGRITGCEVELIDINPARAAIAQALGVAFALPARARDDVDVVLHASGTQEGLQLALAIAGFESTVLELSWYGDRAVNLSLGEAFHARRLSLKSSQVGSVAPARRARWSNRRRLLLALSLLTDPALDVLINSEGTFDQLPATLAALALSSGDTIMHRVRYSPDA
ncbi:MAG TPA: zinc-binding alcohol dehydrogenase [Steroidobacteraceae bacterium]|nr:zinc-binding alcohol dehydrogenase [Steroidobacteraceae bacterium]